MKKIFTLDDIMVAFVSAMGYGFGYTIPEALGCHTVICFVLCFAVGLPLEEFADKIVFSKYVQKKMHRRYLVFACIALLFIACYVVLELFFAHSLWEDLNEELMFAVVFPVIGFFFSMARRAFKKKKLLEKYGTGESGFRFDENAEELWKDVFGTNAELSSYDGKDPSVKTIGGTYIGKKVKGCVRFLGIPYATAERWQKPMPAAASDRIREAYYFGNSEIQPSGSHNILNRLNQGEDCLNLNIWTANLEPQAKKPVVVYFHGGDGRYGGSAHPMYHLENLAKAIPEAVFVSINYRFGVLGVVDFSASGCSDAGKYSDSRSLTLLDQIEALKWIKANIAAFGGDPENITAAGDSAGGVCVCLLAGMKQAKGLFKRAIVLCASTWDAPTGNGSASKLGRKLAEEFHAGSVAELQKLTAEQLREFSTKYYGLLELPPRDDTLVPEDVDQAYLDGAASGVEFIFGIAQDDASGWQAMVAGEVSLDDQASTSYGRIPKLLDRNGVKKMDALLQKYMQNNDRDKMAAKRAMMSDLYSKANPSHDFRSLTKAGCRVHVFYWDVKGDIEKLTANGASMVTAILGNTEIAEQMGYLHDDATTEIMQAFVGKFIQGKLMEIFNNELKGVSRIKWNAFDTEREYVLNVQRNNIRMTETVFSENVRALEQAAFES